MEFEYDEIKSKINKKKHGIDFIEANRYGMILNILKFLPRPRMNPGFSW
jgi:uncharacterized DUF497 family protein